VASVRKTLQRSTRIRLMLVVLLILLGIAMELNGYTDIPRLVDIARDLTQHWWLILVLILLQALLFSFALAGSLFLWIAAPLYPPPMATLILAVGGTLGGLGAYGFAGYLTEEWRHRIERSRAYRLLQAQDNFLTMFAMRIFPAFPHAIVNYSAGMLKARLGQFVIAALLGISIKSYLYASVIHTASSNLRFDILFDLRVYGPLIALSLASITAVAVNYHFSKEKF
jgi:uncharacterized membrane protein YdjX (TVP38/TMEM64 family)